MGAKLGAVAKGLATTHVTSSEEGRAQVRAAWTRPEIGGQQRKRQRDFADLCLTTWLRRRAIQGLNLPVRGLLENPGLCGNCAIEPLGLRCLVRRWVWDDPQSSE